MDLPRYCGGRPSPRRSGRPPIYAFVNHPSESTKYQRAKLKGALNEANKRKRTRKRAEKAAVTFEFSPIPCFRRLLESLGLNADKFSFIEPRTLYSAPRGRVYEVSTGLLPFASFTSVQEAHFQTEAIRSMYPSAHFRLIDLNKPK